MNYWNWMNSPRSLNLRNWKMKKKMKSLMSETKNWMMRT
jgi:hypothetical protein